MKGFELERKARFRRPLDEVFGFFSDPRNLEAITPPWLNFRITTPGPIHMREGTRITYRLRVHGIPLTWISEITAWEPPHRFVDTQIKGPYLEWVHEHRFQPVDGGTEVRDRVDYRVPGGALVNRFLVRPDIERIFNYRTEALRSEFRDLPTM